MLDNRTPKERGQYERKWRKEKLLFRWLCFGWDVLFVLFLIGIGVLALFWLSGRL